MSSYDEKTGLDYATRCKIREFIRQHPGEPWTAKQIATHFRLPAEAEPEITWRLAIETELAGVLPPPPQPGPPRPARDLAVLAREIRNAWLVTETAIPLLADVVGADLDDPDTASRVQAREQAFGWALAELVDGGYSAPAYQVTALSNGVLPVPETEVPWA
jgi:hypothetical protein